MATPRAAAGNASRAAAAPAPGGRLPRHALPIALGLSLGPAVAVGLARFAYGLILPAMRSDLGWSYTQAGWVNTANALGYLAGSLLALRLVERTGPAWLFRVGMAVTAASLVATGLARDFGLLLGLRAVAGLGGAWIFIGGGALAAALGTAHPPGAPSAIAIYFGGGGLGILLSGLVLPGLFAARGQGAWDEAWLLLGVLSAGLCLPALWAAARVVVAPPSAVRARLAWRPFLPAATGYFLFAVGSIVYMTFVVAWMRGRGAGAAMVSLVWGVLGVANLISPIPWRGALARWTGARALAASSVVCALGAAIPLASRAPAAMVASAALFGGAFFIPPASVTALSRRALPPAAWGAAIAGFTVMFAAGQPIGPVLAGAIADATGTLFAGLATSVAVLLLAALAALAQGEPAASR